MTVRLEKMAKRFRFLATFVVTATLGTTTLSLTVESAYAGCNSGLGRADPTCPGRILNPSNGGTSPSQIPTQVNITPTTSFSFVHAPNGDWSKAHSDTIIDFVSWNGSKWRSRIEGGRFVHAPNGDWSKAHSDTIIDFVSWNRSKWRSRLTR